MQKLAEICVRRPVFATMLILSLTVVGLFSFTSLGVDLFPKIDLPTITVTVVNPGASPREVENGENLLKPGQFVTVRILLPQTDPAILVPARAVRTEGSTSRVYVIRDGVAQERLVQTGQREGDLVEIKGNVAADELVATSNVEQLADGVPVRQ